MGTLLVIGVAAGLWAAVFVAVLAVCRVAQRGDEMLISEPPYIPEEPAEAAADPALARPRRPFRGLHGRPRVH